MVENTTDQNPQTGECQPIPRHREISESLAPAHYQEAQELTGRLAMNAVDIVAAAFAVVVGIGIWAAIVFYLSRLTHMKPSASTVGCQARATRALLKFCVDHRSELYVENIRDCLAALESGDVDAAVESYNRVHFGPYGFGDWFPPVVCEHEDGEYVWTVFEALCERWGRLMELLKKGQRVS